MRGFKKFQVSVKWNKKKRMKRKNNELKYMEKGSDLKKRSERTSPKVLPAEARVTDRFKRCVV